MEAIVALQTAYDDASDSDHTDSDTPATEDELLHLKPLPTAPSLSIATIKSAPDVITKDDVKLVQVINHVDNKTVLFNPTYEQMHAPEQGPANPFKTKQQLAQKNMLSGYVQDAHFNHFNFENQRRTFHSYGYAIDPSVDSSSSGDKIVVSNVDFDHDPDEQKTYKEATPVDARDAKTVFEKVKKRPEDKRKRIRQNDASDLEGFLGPWGGFVDEQKIAKPDE
uniref:Uncharacterized protein n=1 Tax=Ciona savignyi TaxID=51511 RepID=H2YRL7_CIOSA